MEMVEVSQINPSMPPAPQDASVDARLDRLEHSVSALQTKVNKEQPKSKTVLSLLFGAVGAKLGWTTGHLIGAPIDGRRNYARAGSEGLTEYLEVFTTLGTKHKWRSLDIARYTLLLGGAIGTLGAIGGFMVGWNRGDRVDKPEELITHPIRSFKKLIGPAPLKAEKEVSFAPEGKIPAATVISQSDHEGTVSTSLRQQEL